MSFTCDNPDITGKYVSLHVFNKYEDVIICELEVYQVQNAEIQDGGSSASSSEFGFNDSDFPLAPFGSSSSDSWSFSDSDSSSKDSSKDKSDENEEDSGDGWFDDEELLSMQSGFIKRS